MLQKELSLCLQFLGGMKASAILQNHNLKCTECRTGIIDVLQQSDTALTENQIKDALHNKFDRTTFYRTFKTLVEKNVLHSISLHETLLYMVNSGEEKAREHYHFYCSNCKKILCLHPQKQENISLPEGFKIKQTEIMIEGTCEKCNF